MRRIARGVQRYVIEARQPFVVDTPAGKVVPTFVQTGYGERDGQAPRVPGLDKPLGTVVAGGAKHALVTAFLAKHFGGNYTGPGAPLTDPMHTVTTQDHHALVCAFLTKYYGNERDGVDVRDPMHTIPTVDRFGLVTVEQQQYRIADIGMRMLEPRELYRAQGFPESYQIAPVIAGKPLPKRAQVRMCGNSVSPPLAAAIVRANVPELMTFNTRELRQLEAA
jgi:DNA (cytosine-5)-methyltransferase 1